MKILYEFCRIINPKSNNISYYFSIFFIVLLSSAPFSLPTLWSGNEVNYFDLAFRTVAPNSFSEQHAVFDSSSSRVVPFWMIGQVINVMGFEEAKRVFSVLFWISFSASLAWVFSIWRADIGTQALAFSAFFVSGQYLLGGEWIFGTVEPKSFAYITVAIGIAAGFQKRYLFAAVATALATYFHFLVGGFWFASIILLYVISRGVGRRLLRVIGLYALLTAPLLVLIVYERIVIVTDTTGIDRSLSSIYAVFRAPHHLAPFIDLSVFFRSWWPGAIGHAALAISFFVIFRLSRLKWKVLALWLCILNAYIVVALAIAFVDSQTHLFSAFYMFRPSSLVLLFSLVGIAVLVREIIVSRFPARLNLVSVVLVAGFLLPSSLAAISNFVTNPVTLEEQVQPSGRALAEWIAENLEPHESFLLQPPRARPSLAEGGARNPHLSIERLSGRGSIVNFKFVPTAKSDLVRWYRLLEARTLFFAGDCSQVDQLRPDYVFVFEQETFERIRSCGEVVGQVSAFAIIRIP